MKNNQENISVMEPVNFCYLNVEAIDKCPLSTIIRPLRFVAAEWNLNLSKTKELKLALKILKMSVKCN